MADPSQIAYASKVLAVCINFLVPFFIAAVWHVATYDWKNSSGHDFEVGAYGFFLGLVVFGGVAGSNSFGYAVSLGVAPPISSKYATDLYVFSTLAGVLGPAAIAATMAVLSKFCDHNPGAKRWVDENFPTYLMIVGIAAPLCFNFALVKLAFVVRWLLPAA